jgi:ABC-type dipeptide/oligopeptide/nickel transport system ATPase component
MNYLELKDLRLAYGHAEHVVGPISFEIRSGEAFGLIGESGAGKTTVALELLGLLHYRGGRRLSGVIVPKPDPQQIAYIPQDPQSGLDPLFTIGSQLSEISRDPVEVSRALDMAHLPLQKISLKSYPHELSGGMRQRLLIAMALLKKPKLIIADEPTSSLDVTLQKGILSVFNEIRQTGVTFLLITHNLPLALCFCDRIAILRYGQLLETGETEKVFRHSSHPYTRLLVESVPKS